MTKFVNTLWTNDNLFVLNGLNSESVDLIYLDPPFNSKRVYSALIGSRAAGASFKDMWTWGDVDEDYLDRMFLSHPALASLIRAVGGVHGKAMMAYITYMAQRVIEMHRVLKSTGTLYLHCDPSAGHYLKVMLDAVFGRQQFVSEIVWNYGTPSGGRVSGKKPVKTHETLLVFAKQYGAHFYQAQFLPYGEKYVKEWFRHRDEDGRAYQTRSRAGKIVRQYLDESPGVPLSDVWSDIRQLYGQTGWFPRKDDERTGYPTQKPLGLLERVVAASSREGEVVLDPFCGCATTCVAAQRLGRRWMGVDIEREAAKILLQRLQETKGIFGEEFVHRVDVPRRSDVAAAAPEAVGVRQGLWAKQGGKCNGCGGTYALKDFEVDHIVPRARGGGDYVENYQLLCGNCNRIKGQRPMAYLRNRLRHLEKTLEETIRFGE